MRCNISSENGNEKEAWLSGTENVLWDSGRQEKSDDGFKVKMRSHQGLILNPFLFSVLMDKVEFKIRHEPQWIMMFTDNTVTCSKTRQQPQESLEGCRYDLKTGGIKVRKRDNLMVGSRVQHINKKWRLLVYLLIYNFFYSRCTHTLIVA